MNLQSVRTTIYSIVTKNIKTKCFYLAPNNKISHLLDCSITTIMSELNDIYYVCLKIKSEK